MVRALCDHRAFAGALVHALADGELPHVLGRGWHPDGLVRMVLYVVPALPALPARPVHRRNQGGAAASHAWTP